MLFPGRCGGCRRLGPSPCAACRLDIGPARLGQAVAGLDRVVACFDYGGPLRPMAAALKYRGNRACVGWMAAQLADRWQAEGLEGVLTWAPTSGTRARRRGFDQSALLARALTRELRRRGLAVERVELLRRLPGPAQTGRVGRARQEQVRFAARRPAPPAVVLLDDVITTGATMAAAAAVLRQAGATSVSGLAVARTAPPARRPA